MKLRWLFQDRLGRRGIAAVEFALVIPVLLVMFIGTIEVLTLYRTEAKLNAVASNIAQMISIQASPIVLTTGTPETGTSLNDICSGVIQGLQPFPSAGLTIAVASVTLESNSAGLPTSSSAHTSSPTNNAWEGDSKVSGGTCSTTSGTQIGLTNAFTMAGGGNAGNKGLLEVPCDNAIIVQASIPYPGLTGLIVRSRPTLTQTAFARWVYASTTTELTCPTCTVTKATQICKTGNTATN
jgi:Flp pilus assembly protein TadG